MTEAICVPSLASYRNGARSQSSRVQKALSTGGGSGIDRLGPSNGVPPVSLQLAVQEQTRQALSSCWHVGRDASSHLKRGCEEARSPWRWMSLISSTRSVWECAAWPSVHAITNGLHPGFIRWSPRPAPVPKFSTTRPPARYDDAVRWWQGNPQVRQGVLS